ncbi:unnamed protein product [Linum trigynum]|uniref:Uncharacterized protein n=1 Tax=Linum trigynum TaxID=586398 RepID=A0AAV2F6L7_9ROSI
MELANANRPNKKKKKAGKTAKTGGASSSVVVAGKTLLVVSSSQAQLAVDPSGMMDVASIPLTRGAGKRSLEQGIPVVTAKRAKASTSNAKVGDQRGKAVKQPD